MRRVSLIGMIVSSGFILASLIAGDLNAHQSPPRQVPVENQAVSQKAELGKVPLMTSPHMDAFSEPVYHASTHPFDPARMFVGTRHGLFLSDDAGQTWSEVRLGGESKTVYTIASSPADYRVLLAGTRDGLMKSDDGGNQWVPITAGLPAGHVPLSISICAYAPDDVYMGTSRHGVFRSVDGGSSWEAARQGLPTAAGGTRMAPIRSLVVDPANAEVAYAGTELSGFFKTTNGGQTWQAINAGLPQLILRRTYPPRLAISPEDSSVIYAAIGRAVHSQLVRTFLYRSTNGGQSWQLVDMRFPPNITVLSLEVDATDQGIVFVRSLEGDFRVETPIVKEP